MSYWFPLVVVALVCSVADAQPVQNGRQGQSGQQGQNARRGQGRSGQPVQQSGGFQRQTQPAQQQFGSQPGNRVQNQQNSHGQQRTSGVQIRRSNREEQNATREFTVNALRFDFNGDRQLSANELQNMFVFLATQQNQAIGPYVNGGYRRQLGQRLLGTTGSGQRGGIQTTTTTTTIGPAVQGLAIQRAVQVFLQLILQFDLNSDGMLSQAELMRFAQALLQNDMSLVNASNQARNRVATTTTTTTTRTNRNGRFSNSLPINFVTGSIPLNSPNTERGSRNGRGRRGEGRPTGSPGGRSRGGFGGGQPGGRGPGAGGATPGGNGAGAGTGGAGGTGRAN